MIFAEIDALHNQQIYVKNNTDTCRNLANRFVKPQMNIVALEFWCVMAHGILSNVNILGQMDFKSNLGRTFDVM